jgi:hypothetical protein
MAPDPLILWRSPSIQLSRPALSDYYSQINFSIPRIFFSSFNYSTLPSLRCSCTILCRSRSFFPCAPNPCNSRRVPEPIVPYSLHVHSELFSSLDQRSLVLVGMPPARRVSIAKKLVSRLDVSPLVGWSNASGRGMTASWLNPGCLILHVHSSHTGSAVYDRSNQRRPIRFYLQSLRRPDRRRVSGHKHEHNFFFSMQPVSDLISRRFPEKKEKPVRLTPTYLSDRQSTCLRIPRAKVSCSKQT